jgi:hypothetical protein
VSYGWTCTHHNWRPWWCHTCAFTAATHSSDLEGCVYNHRTSRALIMLVCGVYEW